MAPLFEDQVMSAGQIVSESWADIRRFSSLAELLREHGVDLCRIDPSELPLERGTPIYVDALADEEMVQRRMILGHIRLVFVLDGQELAGALDLVEMVNAAEDEVWTQVK